MYPADKTRALISVLEAENAFRALSTAAFEMWLPAARMALVPTLTADVNDADIVPDPNAIGQTQPVWETAVDRFMVYGAEIMYGREMIDAYAALGGQADELIDNEIDADDTDEHKRARKIIASAIGQTPGFVAKIRATIQRSPAVLKVSRAYALDVRDKMLDTPSRLVAELAQRIDTARVDNVPVRDIRQMSTGLLDLDSGRWISHADEIARTETTGAMSLATIEAAKLRNDELDEQLESVWIATLDGKTRRSHFAADGQRVPLGERFRVGSARLRGPGDPSGPPEETARCRCRVGVLAVDEKLPGESDRHTERLDGRDSTARNREGTQADEIARRADDGVIRARDDPDGVGRTASVGTDDKEMAVTAPIETDETEAPADEVEAPAEETTSRPDGEYRTFTDGILAFLDTATSDSRKLAADITLKFRTFPLPLLWVEQSSMGHEGAYTVGVIESAKIDGDKILGSGYLLNTAEADKAAEQLGHGVTGPSVDLADVTWMLVDADGNEITDYEELWENPDAVVFDYYTAAELVGATLVAIPAFGDTKIVLDEAPAEKDDETVDEDIAASALTASAGRRSYSSSHFADPKFTKATPIHMDDDGRISGHLATWSTCHVGISDRCVMAPKSKAEYAHFLVSPPVDTDAGSQPVGRLTVDTGHAAPRLSAGAALAHYDNTGTCFALVNVGEDKHGIWFSGVAAPGATAEQIEAGLAAPLSGDWRQRGGNLELIAALSVNTPGFPIIASGASDDHDRPMTLVASIGPRPAATRKAGALSADDVTRIVNDAVRATRAADRREAAATALLATAQTSQAAHNRRVAARLLGGVRKSKGK